MTAKTVPAAGTGGADAWHLNRERELAALRAEQVNIGKKINLLEQLMRLEQDYCQENTAAKPVALAKRKAPANKDRSQTIGQPQPSRLKDMQLPEILEAIGAQHNKAFKHEELTALVKATGYTSSSKNFSNMIYQCLQKLCKRGTFVKDAETRLYRYIGSEA